MLRIRTALLPPISDQPAFSAGQKNTLCDLEKKQRTCGFHYIRVRVSDLLCKKSRSSGMLLRLMINYVRSDFSKSFPIKALQGSGSDQADDSKQRSQAPV
jgi:hypothetical protein